MNIHNEMPVCVGFIMDGNRRWAKAKGLTTAEGHVEGYQTLKRIIDSVYDAGIPHIVCYAFSTENWNRSEDEVFGLLNLFKIALHNLEKEHRESSKKINIKFIGDRNRFDDEIQIEMKRVESSAIPDAQLTVWVALSYGGRAEILSAVNAAVRGGKEVTEDSFEKLLTTSGMPDPDLIIRTSGEERLSNFLLWQSAYSELFFTKTLWPDFGETEFKGILDEYGKRQRRKGI